MLEIFRRKSPIQSGQSTQNRIIAEVGCGSLPFVCFPQGQSGLNEGDLYIGIDQFDDEKEKNLAEERLNEKIPGAHVLYKADARQLPLLSQTADEVIYCNVMGDIRVRDIRQQLLHEAHRVVTKTGVVTVVETYSPTATPIKELRTIARKEKLSQTNRNREHEAQDIDRYNPFNIHPQRYIATFTPRKKNWLRTLLRI